MSWILVPLQYLYLRWSAERLVSRAAAASGTPRGTRLLVAAAGAVARVEEMQERFPNPTAWLDNVTRRNALRHEMGA